MTKKLLYSYLLVLAYLLLELPTLAQQSDFQCWPSVQVNAEIIKRLRLQIEEEARFNENSSQISRQINDIGLTYRINKFIRTAIFYRLEADWKNVENYVWRRGVYGDLSLNYKAGRFSLGYRIRAASAKVEINEKQPLLAGFTNRHKLSLEYDIKNSRFAPFVEGELFLNLGDQEKNDITAYRAWIGCNYRFNKIHEIAVKYGIDQELNTTNPITAYIIALQYSINLKLGSAKKKKDLVCSF